MILVGELALWIALLMAAWGAIVSFAGASAERADLVASGERALLATFASLVLAIAGLLVALVTSDLSFAYVASFTTANMPVGYKLVALWAGPSGVLLFWALLLGTCGAVAVATNRARNRELMPYVVGTLSIVLLFFIVALCFGVSPYERTAPIPVDGRGMSPELQHPAMALHPPTLSLGYCATAVPFAFSIAALIARRADDEWAYTVQRWVTASWFFLTIGIITGMWWAYVEPTRHEGWVSTPIRSLAFAPWLVTTTFLAIRLLEAKRDARDPWTVVLGPMSFLLALSAAFINRRGIVASLSASGPPGLRGWWIGFLILGAAIVVYLIVTRWRDSRLTRAVTRSTFPGHRTRLGGYIAGVGAVAFLIAVAAAPLSTARDVSLGPGEAVTLVDPFRRSWTFTSQGVSDFPELNRGVEAVALRATRDGSSHGLIISERRQYVDSRGAPTFEPSVEAGIDYSALQDTHVVLTNVVGDRADLRIAFHPLQVWVWIGGIAIAIGGSMMMWPTAGVRGSDA